MIFPHSSIAVDVFSPTSIRFSAVRLGEEAGRRIGGESWRERYVFIAFLRWVNGHATGTDLLEVPIPDTRSIFQAYVRGYPNKIWSYMVQYLHFRILKFPLYGL